MQCTRDHQPLAVVGKWEVGKWEVPEYTRSAHVIRKQFVAQNTMDAMHMATVRFQRLCPAYGGVLQAARLARLTTMPRHALPKKSSLFSQKMFDASVERIVLHSPFITANATNAKKETGANQYCPSTTPNFSFCSSFCVSTNRIASEVSAC